MGSGGQELEGCPGVAVRSGGAGDGGLSWGSHGEWGAGGGGLSWSGNGESGAGDRGLSFPHTFTSSSLSLSPFAKHVPQDFLRKWAEYKL